MDESCVYRVNLVPRTITRFLLVAQEAGQGPGIRLYWVASGLVVKVVDCEPVLVPLAANISFSCSAHSALPHKLKTKQKKQQRILGRDH